MRIKYSLFVVVVVGVGKGLGSVKETVSTIQELGKKRERESVTALLPVQGIYCLEQ